MIRRVIEFLGTASAAWLAVVAIRFARDLANTAWWFALVAVACVAGLFAVLMAAELAAAAIRSPE